jgi:hypothetical protein
MKWSSPLYISAASLVCDAHHARTSIKGSDSDRQSTRGFSSEVNRPFHSKPLRSMMSVMAMLQQLGRRSRAFLVSDSLIRPRVRPLKGIGCLN